MIERLRAGVLVGCLLVTACAQTPPPAPKTAAGATASTAVAKAPAGPTVGPAVTLLPAATARPYQLATVSVGSVDRLLANGVKLVGSAVPLPMTAEGVRDMLLSEAGLAPDVAANLDLGSPGSAAVVALDDKGRSGVVLAIPARGPAEADKLIAAMGKPVMTSGPLTMLANSAGKTQGWVYRAGSVVLLGDEVDAMARGAMLALEARHPGPDDVTATIYPEAMAHAHGTDVKTAIATFLEQMRQVQAATNPFMATDNSFTEVMAKMLGTFADAERIEVGVSVDPARGLVLHTRLVSRPGTALEAIARDVRPFAIDPIVLGAASKPVMIGSISVGAFWQEVFGLVRGRLAADKDKGAPAALAYWDAYMAALKDSMSAGEAMVDKTAPYLTGVFVTSLKDAPAAAKLGAALGRMDVAALNALFRAQLGGAAALFEWTAKRETVGKAKAMHIRLRPKKDGVLDSEALRKAVGAGFEAYQAVVGTRLVATLGRDSRARLAAVVAGKTGSPLKNPSFSEAEAGAKGRDAFYYFDIGPIVSLLGTTDMSPRLAAAARHGVGSIPLVFTGGGDGVGKVWSGDMTLPPAAFSSIGALATASQMAGR